MCIMPLHPGLPLRIRMPSAYAECTTSYNVSPRVPKLVWHSSAVEDRGPQQRFHCIAM